MCQSHTTTSEHQQQQQHHHRLTPESASLFGNLSVEQKQAALCQVRLDTIKVNPATTELDLLRAQERQMLLAGEAYESMIGSAQRKNADLAEKLAAAMEMHVEAIYVYTSLLDRVRAELHEVSAELEEERKRKGETLREKTRVGYNKPAAPKQQLDIVSASPASPAPIRHPESPRRRAAASPVLPAKPEKRARTTASAFGKLRTSAQDGLEQGLALDSRDHTTASIFAMYEACEELKHQEWDDELELHFSSNFLATTTDSSTPRSLLSPHTKEEEQMLRAGDKHADVFGCTAPTSTQRTMPTTPKGSHRPATSATAPALPVKRARTSQNSSELSCCSASRSPQSPAQDRLAHGLALPARDHTAASIFDMYAACEELQQLQQDTELALCLVDNSLSAAAATDSSTSPLSPCAEEEEQMHRAGDRVLLFGIAARASSRIRS